MKKLKKIKMIILSVFLFIMIVDLFLSKIQLKKIEQMKKEYLKTNIENIFIQKGEKFNLAIIKGNSIREFKDLDNIGEINENKPILILKNGKYGYIKINGEDLIPIEYDAIGIFSDGKVLAKKNEKVGVLNEKGEEVLPLKYNEIYIGENNNFILKENDEYLSYNLKDKLVLNIDEVYKINEKILIFSKDNKFGIINYKGEVIVPNDYDEISTFVDKTFIGLKSLKYSLYNLKNEKISNDYDFIEQIGDNEYRGGYNEVGNYAFLSKEISTEDKYENIKKINEYIYIGELNNNTSDIIELKSKLIKNIMNKNIEKYIAKMKKEESNE